jgi:signal transduction histidine kinase
MQDLKEIQRTSIISIFPLALLSFVLGYFLSGRFLKPIENLQLSISKLGKADLGKTIQVKNDDEVGKLIESFNGMSKRLKQAFDAQDNFVQDAQHELKTPLTIIHTNLDTALDDKTASNQELREAISNSLGAIKQMRALTNNLLDLTLPSEESQSTINLGNLVEGQINMLRTYADSMKVNLVFSHPEKELSIIANELAIQRAVFNIIENAIKYSANEENPKVKVQVISEQDKAIIKIIDNGPGIPLEQQQKIFERFYRLDKSRNKKSGGFGLGLAIAKKFIAENSGEILLQSEPGNTEFNLSFRAVREKKQKHIGK